MTTKLYSVDEAKAVNAYLNREYAFCEPVWVTGPSPWCVRRLTDKGRKTSGGIDTKSLCGRVDPTKGGGWDLSEKCIISIYHPHMCPRCKGLLEKRLANRKLPSQ
jgi:hypothetical protein